MSRTAIAERLRMERLREMPLKDAARRWRPLGQGRPQGPPAASRARIRHGHRARNSVMQGISDVLLGCQPSRQRERSRRHRAGRPPERLLRVVRLAAGPRLAGAERSSAGSTRPGEDVLLAVLPPPRGVEHYRRYVRRPPLAGYDPGDEGAGTKTAAGPAPTATTGPVTSSPTCRPPPRGGRPLLEPSLDVLDDDADRQHQTEQRDVIEAEAEVRPWRRRCRRWRRGRRRAG